MKKIQISQEQKKQILFSIKKLIKEQASTDQNVTTPDTDLSKTTKETEKTSKKEDPISGLIGDEKKLRAYIASGCLKKGKILSNSSRTKFIYRIISNSGLKIDIMPDLTYTIKSSGKKGKVYCEPIKPTPATGEITPTSATTATGEITPTPATGEITPFQHLGKAGEKLFNTLNSNYETRTKPFLKVFRTYIVFKGDVAEKPTSSEQISLSQLQSLDEYIKQLKGYERNPAKSKQYGEKYIWS